MSNTIEQVLHTNIYIQPIHFTLAILTNIVNIRILCCRVLRLSPCTHYFLTYAIFSIIYTCLICPTQFLRAFNINWANGKLNCRINNYILFLIPFQANIMLVFAAFDRYCSSSQSRQLHSTSTIRTARIIIIIGTISCMIYMIPMFFMSNWDDNTKRCLPVFSLLVNVYIISQIILYCILAPLLMIIFGLLTIANIRKQSARVIPLMIAIRRRRIERNLTRMLLLQVGVHLIIIMPYGIIYSMNSLDPSTQTSQIIAIRLAFVTWQQCDYFISFFLYILSANIYRQQLLRILKSIIHSDMLMCCFRRERRGIIHQFPLGKVNVQQTNNIES